MTLQRVQMLLEPEQRRKLAELALAQRKSVAEVTRQAIDMGLQQLTQVEHKQRMRLALKAAQELCDSMPVLELDIAADIRQMREERDDEFFSRG